MDSQQVTDTSGSRTGGTPPIRGEQDRYTFTGMPIYREDAASLHSHDRLRFCQMSDVDSQEPSQTLQGTRNVAPEQNHIEEGLDDGTPRGATSLPEATNLVSSTRDNGENRGMASSIAHEAAGEKPVKKTWRARWRALRSGMMQRTSGAEDLSCQIAKPFARSVQWVSQRCLCRNKDEDGPSEGMSRQSIRLVQV